MQASIKKETTKKIGLDHFPCLFECSETLSVNFQKYFKLFFNANFDVDQNVFFLGQLKSSTIALPILKNPKLKKAFDYKWVLEFYRKKTIKVQKNHEFESLQNFVPKICLRTCR